MKILTFGIYFFAEKKIKSIFVQHSAFDFLPEKKI